MEIKNILKESKIRAKYQSSYKILSSKVQVFISQILNAFSKFMDTNCQTSNYIIFKKKF